MAKSFQGVLRTFQLVLRPFTVLRKMKKYFKLVKNDTIKVEVAFKINIYLK
jgi:hypothetical protein